MTFTEKELEIKRTADHLRSLGLPDVCNKWLKMTPAALIENEKARARLSGQHAERTPAPRIREQDMTKIGTKEQSLRAARAEPKRKLHAADAAHLAAIAGAKSFSVSLLHQGKHETVDGLTLDEARAKGAALETETGSNRRSLVYAVLEDGKSVLLPRDYQATPSTAPQTQESAVKTATQKKATAKPAKPAPGKARAKDGARQAGKKAATENARKPVAAPSEANGERRRFDWRGAEEAAAKGKLPPKLDFSADTHKPFRPLLAEIEQAAKNRDAAALKKIKHDGFRGSSVKAALRYRDICLTALTVKT